MKSDTPLKIIGLCLFMMAAAPVGATVIYQYSGNPFTTVNNSGSGTAYDTTMGVDLSLTFASPLAANLSEQILSPASFTITDGINTINSTNATSASVRLGTDAAGNINKWFIYTSRDFGGGDHWYIETINSTLTTLVWDFGRTVTGGFTNTANVTDATGGWSVSAVPAPATVWLFGLGLVALTRHTCRRRKYREDRRAP